jgi:hypothetical protein
VASLLRKRLARRFGVLPRWVEVNITHASPELLEEWSLRLDENPTLLELFA